MRLEKCDKYLKEIEKIYEDSFPENERSDFDYLLNGRYENFEMLAIMDQNKLVGFIYVAFYKNIVYINYFAIKEEFRNCGYGSMALKLLQEKFQDYNILLSIEKPVSEMQKRRLRFYQRNKFVSTGFELKTHGVEYQVLCYGNYDENVLLEFFKLYFPNAKY